MGAFGEGDHSKPRSLLSVGGVFRGLFGSEERYEIGGCSGFLQETVWVWDMMTRKLRVAGSRALKGT